MNTTDDLWKEFENRMIFNGHYLLTSGNHSDIYFNKYLIWVHPDLRERTIRSLRNLIVSRYVDLPNYNNVVVTGPATAGSLWANAVARMFGLPFIYCEKDTQNGHDIMIFRRGFEKYVKDSLVLIIEDIMTTGKSLRLTWEAVYRNHGAVMNYFCIWNRKGKDPNSVFKKEAENWDPKDCELCKKKVPLYSFK